MGLNTAFGGITPDLPLVSTGWGVRTPFGILLPPGSQVAAYVRSTGIQSGEDASLGNMLVSTLAAGLARCRPGMGDVVVCLPGHTESGVGTTGLANLVAGTRVVGLGRGSAMPTFRWTAPTDNWAFNKNDVVFQGLRLRMEGANGVTEGITWTGTDCALTGCDIEVASGASNKAVTAINISGNSAHRAEIVGNIIRGTTGSLTDGILLSSTADCIRVTDNELTFPVAVSVTHGLITVSGAVTNVKILRNMCSNNVASTCAIAVADVASTGIIADNYLGVLTNGTAANIGIIFAATTTTTIRCFQDFTSDEAGKSGVLAPGAAS